MNLSIKIKNLILKNPVMTASGTFGYGQENAEFFDLSLLGAVVVKGLSIKPSLGNPPPRIWETPCGMLNSIGLQNIGVAAFIKDKLPWLRQFDTKIIANFYGNDISEFVEVARVLSEAGIDALEMNVSCPNKQAGWIAFGTDPDMLARVVSEVRKVTELPLIVKLSPNVTDITMLAKTAMDAGADALSLINTLTGMAIDIETKKPRLSNVIGGLSGPAIRPVAIKMVYQVHKAMADVPIIGMGGILNGADAVEFMLAGATGVAVGTANFIDPAASVKVLDGIVEYMKRRHIDDINDLIGGVII